MKHTAALKRKGLPGFTGRANLYELSPPLQGHRFVVVSATVAMFSGPEVLVFPSDENGNVVSWGDIAGYQGGLDIEAALTNEGYEVVNA